MVAVREYGQNRWGRVLTQQEAEQNILKNSDEFKLH